MVIAIINNYLKKEDMFRIEIIVEALKKLGQNPRVMAFTEIDTCKLDRDFQALILSGSSASLLEEKNLKLFQTEMEVVRTTDYPILGLCFGHQLIGATFGASLYSSSCVKGFSEIEILVDDRIFYPHKAGSKLVVMQNHYECLVQMPISFVHLAKSQTCKLEAMKHKKLPIYSFQSHLERFSDQQQAGLEIIKNFVNEIAVAV